MYFCNHFKVSNFKFGTQIGFESGTSLSKNDVQDQNWRGSGLGEHPKKIWDPLCIFSTVEASKFKFGTQIGFGTSLPKTMFRTKISGDLGQGAHTKNWDPLRISATVEARNFKFGTQIWFETSLPKKMFRTKIGGGLARGASKKVGPLLISATVETSNFKFGIQLGFGTILPKNNVQDQNWRGEAWARGASEKNLGPPIISATVEARD